MRIVFLIRSLEYGGSQRQLVLLARGLAERGHRVSVVTLYAGGALEAELRDGPVRLFTLGKRSRWDFTGWIVRLTVFLRREHPEIVHGYLEAGNILSVLLRPICRFRVVWGMRASEMRVSRYERFIRSAYRFERALSVFPDLFIANSNAGRAHAIMRGFPARRVVVIPNGIDTERFRPDRACGSPLRKEWGAGPDEALIGVVARIDPIKDHPTFLRAAARLISRNPNARFVCVGSGSPDLERELRQLSETLGLEDRVVWAGERSDMAEVYNACDLVCLPSFGEGFPNVVAEAMACGVRCVVSEVGDSASIVEDPALVVPPADPERLAVALKAALDRPRSDDTRAALHRRIEERFGIARFLDATESGLKSLLMGQSDSSGCCR